MPIDYATMQTRVLTYLVATTANYSAATLGYWFENELKRLSYADPHIVDITFQIESRSGVASTTLANNLVDSVKGQFIATDDDNEKVVHNIMDDTWTVVKTYTDANTLALTNDIFTVTEEYEIYNKRCKNKRQIYIGDMPPYLWVDSVEYPIGTERNFTVKDNVLELDVEDDVIQDSDSTLSTLSEVDVLVRFAFPHVLSQLTDWVGELAASASVAATTLSIDGVQAAGTIEVGEQFTLENMRNTYVITTDSTIAASTAAISFYPPLESAPADNDDITFLKTSLQPQHEDLFMRMVVSRAVSSTSLANINAANVGGVNTWQDFIQWKRDMDDGIRRDLKRISRSKPSKELART